MKELILSFLPEQFAYPDIFRIELAGITYPFPTYHVKRENSHVYSLEYVIAGGGEIHIDKATHFPSEGDVYILPKGHDHHYWSNKKDPMHKLWINVSGSLCDHLFHVYQLHQVPILHNVTVRNIFEEVLEVCKDKHLTNYERSQKSSLLFHKLLETLFYHSQAHLKKPMNEVVLLAKTYLDNHLNQPVNIKSVASLVNLSSSQLTRQFKSALNQTPYDYFLSKKIEMAQMLLVKTQLPVQQIADRLAFSDEHYFSNIFKEKVGCSPTQWRHNHFKNSEKTENSQS